LLREGATNDLSLNRDSASPLERRQG